jgi:hypothetical protein
LEVREAGVGGLGGGFSEFAGVCGLGGKYLGCDVMDDRWKVRSVPPGLLDLRRGQGGRHLRLRVLEEGLCGC